MKAKKLLFLLPFLLLSSCKSSSEDTNDDNVNQVNVNLKVNEVSNFKINPFIYGTFIEHIDTCIYNGIWSEIILDRKFYRPVGEDVSQWSLVEGNISMETKSPFEGEYSLTLKSGASIRQNGISLEKNEEYNGYFYAKGSGKISFTYAYGNESVSVEVTINAQDFQKYEYSFFSPFTSKRAKLVVASVIGDLTIDSLSLMPSDNYYGMRKDTLDKLKELNSPFYRWPGGNFVSGYDFYDGIGDRDKRPTKRNLNYCGLESDFESDEERLANDLMKIGSLGFYGAFDSNDFGLDEFIIMCRYLNAEPNIVVNSGLGDAIMAADEVSYCNATSGKMAEIRGKEPYNVKYFSIGNEMNGDWQLGHVSINEYVIRHNAFALAMKAVDPTIEIIAVGDNWSSWSQTMVNSCKNNIDYLSEHYYAERKESNVKDHILSLKNQTTTRIEKHRNLSNKGSIKMAIDEYAYENAEQSSRLKDGMGVASALNEMLKNADEVAIACYSSTVNATQGNIATDDFNAYLEGSGYALSLYRNNMNEYFLPVTYKGGRDDNYYEIAATINEEKNEISLSIINTLSEPLTLVSSYFKKIKSVDSVIGQDLESINSESRNELTRVFKDSGLEKVTAEPYSISVYKIEI